jgi:hypothetical protein
MPKIELDGTGITVTKTADVKVDENEVVGLVGDDTVAPIDETNAQSVLGVADTGGQSGDEVDIVIVGEKQVTADGPVSVGDPVRAAPTEGQAVSELQAPAAHTHASPEHQHNVQDHSHTALQSDGTDVAPGAHQAMTDGAGGATTLQVGVDASGQAADTVDTSSNGPGSTDNATPGDTSEVDPGIDNGRTFGKAVTSAGASGDTFTVLVCLTA